MKKDKNCIDFRELPEQPQDQPKRTVSEGISHVPVIWRFCCVCNKSMREQTRGERREKEEYVYIQIGFNESYCSWEPGSSGVICLECFPRVMNSLKDLLPYLNL